MSLFHRYPVLVLHLAILFWAGTSLFAKLIPLPASHIIYLRSVPALVAVSLLLLVFRRGWVNLFNRTGLYALAIGVLTAGHWVSFYQSVQMSSVAIGMITLYTYPLISVVLEPVLLRKRIDRADALTALIGLVGIGCIALEQWQTNVGFGAIAFGMISAVKFSLRNLGSRYLTPDMPSLQQIWIQLAVTLTVLALLLGVEPVQSMTASVWAMLALLGIVFVAFPHTLFLWTIKKMPVTTASLIGMIQPVYAVLMAWVILRESPTLLQLLGGLLVLSTAVITTRKQTS